MSPAPETVRQPSNPSPSLSISTILSRAPQAPNESPAGAAGPLSADRRATSSIRRNFSGGPRPAPFQRQTVTLNEPDSGESTPTRAFLLSALETRRRRIEGLRSGPGGSPNIATTIAEQWRRQREALSSLQYGFRANNGNAATSPDSGPTTPPQRFASPPTRLFIGEESSDSETDDDDDPDNKFSAPMNDVRRTPPPTFLTPNTSPSTTTSSPSNKQNDDDSSRNAYTLSCKCCANVLTRRGMRARLVADARVHIWSTDEQPKYQSQLGSTAYDSVKLVGEKYATTTCQCQLMYSRSSWHIDDDSDIACARCETVVGYHIAGSKPCDTCSRSNHNAHYHLLRCALFLL